MLLKIVLGCPKGTNNNLIIILTKKTDIEKKKFKLFQFQISEILF